MKKMLAMVVAMSMTSALFMGCGDDGKTGETPPPTAPEITLVGGNIDEPQEITPTMSLEVSVTVPGAIAGFTVKIDSPALTAEMLSTVGLAEELDLVNPGDMAGALTTFGFPVGDEVKDQTKASFDISKLVPMISQIYFETSDHKFILKVTDAKGQSTTKTLTCHLTEGPVIALEEGNIDQPQEITPTMKAKVNVSAPGAIAGFTVKIDSPALTADMLSTVGLAEELDLVNPGNMAGALSTFGFPVGDEVKDQTSVSFDISKLVPMIALIYNETSDHKFILKVTDAKGKSATKTLTCHLTGIEAPTIALEEGDIDQPQEITPTMKAKVNITAPGAIAGLTVTIDSPALTPEALAQFGLGTELNLVNPGDMAAALGNMGFPVGDEVKDQTSVSLDISKLAPMISLLYIYNVTSNHKFTVTVTDAKEQSTTKTLTCHLTAKTTLAYNKDADLWANTATVSVEALPEGAGVQYRIKGAADWIDAELVEGSTYKLAPVWTSAKNDAGQDIHSIQAGTGIMAAKTYEVRVVKNGETIDATEFITAAGDKIPNGDMSGWSTVSRAGLGKPADVAYPNAENAEAFWDCGNNGITTTLCTSTEEKVGAAAPAAKLASKNMFVLAAGNLFTGSFDYANMTGTVDFGRKYAWTARPSALKLKYTATVGKVDVVRAKGDMPPVDIKKDDPDNARIFVAIVDWTAPHRVVSAMTTTTGPWDPVNGPDVVSEGKVIGYGSLTIPESASDDADAALKDTELQIYWYDKTAKPADGNYSLVISCACNAYGDYFTGCSKNTMYVDDFEWVY